MTYEPNERIGEAIAGGSSNTVILLFEKRDTKHRYYAKDLGSWSENAAHTGIYRRNFLPDLFLGRFFDRKVAKISYYSYLDGTTVNVNLYEKKLVTEEEVKWAADHGRKHLLMKLESELESFTKELGSFAKLESENIRKNSENKN